MKIIEQNKDFTVSHGGGQYVVTFGRHIIQNGGRSYWRKTQKGVLGAIKQGMAWNTINHRTPGDKKVAKRGRPAIPFVLKKCHAVQGYVSQRQWEKLSRLAQGAGCSNFGQYLRHLAANIL